MHIVKAEELNTILSFLEKDVDNCIYMFIDLKTYGVSSENVTTWVYERHGEILFVVLRYYNSFQIYGKKEFSDWEQVRKLVVENAPSMISGPKWCIEIVEKFSDEYEAAYGSVFRFNNYYSEGDYENVEMAKENDAPEIARLMLSDAEFAANYTYEELSRQLNDRIRFGHGRSFIIRKDGEIVAHVATFAETDKYAVISGSLVDKRYRKDNLYYTLSERLGNILIEEGKTGYAFALNSKMIRWLRYCHIECGQYGKLVRRGM